MRNGLLYTLLTLGVLASSACGSPDGSSGGEVAPDAGESPAATAPAPNVEQGPTVLFLGDSISAGYGLEPDQAFPALLDTRLDSLGIDAVVVNAGLSGETSAGGLRRIDWLLQRPVDVLVLELGGNDGLRGVDLASTRANLQGIIDRTKAQNPEVVVVVAGMMIPPNLGREYTESFAAIFPELAEANDAILIPFLLDGVGGIEAYMLADGIHPNAEGHRRVARLVEPYLLEALESVPVTAP